MNRGVAITGIGLVSAVGDDALGLASAAPSARGGGPTAPIDGFDIHHYVQRKGMRHLSRTSQLACAAASRLAPALAGLEGGQVGVVLGSAWAALDTIVRFEREAWTEGPRFVDPLLFTETVPNVPAGQISILFGWSAINMTLGGGEAAGLEAVARAIDLLEQGRGAAMVAGGVDALHLHVVRRLEAQGSLANGSVPCGEASCLLALESLEAARSRGVVPLARIGLAGAAADELDLVIDADRGLPRCLGRTWAASGPLAIAMAVAGLRGKASALGRTCHGAVLAGAFSLHVAADVPS